MRTPMLKYHYLLLILCSVPFKLLATSPIESNGLADFTDFSDIGVEITPSLAINYKYDDNIANVSSNKTASKLVEIIPALRIVGQKYNNQFTLNYAANKNLYSESESSNFTDHQLQAGINFRYFKIYCLCHKIDDPNCQVKVAIAGRVKTVQFKNLTLFDIRTL